MTDITVNFNSITGKIKPMHAVNNGPYGSRGNSSGHIFEELGIPYARNHDAAFSSAYGGEHGVDVVNIFPDFDADESDPASYDFVLTDVTIRNAFEAGVTPYYRLGNKIEHAVKKYGTNPPKDFHKWARICEHIIAHYTEGWADGFEYDMPYWEIWNEPECRGGIENDRLCWQGTDEEFFEFYAIAAKHLKSRFPHLRIGGPAFTWAGEGNGILRPFMEYLRGHDVPLDFLSFHGYTNDPHSFVSEEAYARALLKEYGYENAETHLNEWNYNVGWYYEDMIRSYRGIRTVKGAAFTAASMLTMQKTSLDLFMYYDARPGTLYNGIFEAGTFDLYPPYYAFFAFNDLHRLGNECESVCGDRDVYVGAAKKDDKAAIVLAYYKDAEDLAAKDVRLSVTHSGPMKVTYKVLDEAHRLDTVRVDYVSGDRTELFLRMEPNSVTELSFEAV